MLGRARFLFLLGLAACGSREERIAEIADEIGTIASKSSCSSYSWEDRSVAPLGYITGMGVAFAKSLCRQIAGDELAQTLAAAKSSDDGADALSWYASSFDAQGLEVAKKGPEALRALYTLGIGLGMRESSGKYCEGYDTTVGSQTANTAEAGLFQTSYDSQGADSALKSLIAEYEADDEACLRKTFAKDVSCSSRDIVGSGEGAAFQRLAKSCPVFAAEYAMTTLRVLRAHYGPINRKEAEVNPACGSYLRDVQSYVAADRDRVCGSLHPAD
jgi:hypothetical protein